MGFWFGLGLGRICFRIQPKLNIGLGRICGDRKGEGRICGAGKGETTVVVQVMVAERVVVREGRRRV